MTNLGEKRRRMGQLRRQIDVLKTEFEEKAVRLNIAIAKVRQSEDELMKIWKLLLAIQVELQELEQTKVTK